MSESKAQWLNMTTAFFVGEDYPEKETVNSFREWLDEESYKEVKNECGNLYGHYYIDIASRTFARANAYILLAPIVGCQTIGYKDFRRIHYIFKNGAEKESSKRFRPEYLTPLSMYLEQKEIARRKREKEIQEYFSKDPSFETWCDDVFIEIKKSPWYIENRPDYSKEEFNKCLDDVYIKRELRYYFERRDLPIRAAGDWDWITF